MKVRNEKSFLLFICIFCLLAGIVIFMIDARKAIYKLREDNKQQDLIIQSHDQQLPYVAEYTVLVEQLAERAEGRMGAEDVVRVARIIMEQCALNKDIGLTPDKVMAMIERESGFDPAAVSSAKAYGLMQVIQETSLIHLPDLGYNRFRVEIIMDPVTNVEVGIRELVRLRRYWLEEGKDNWTYAIHSFFWGTRNTWALLTTKGRASLPSLEYAVGVLELANGWRERGVG